MTQENRSDSVVVVHTGVSVSLRSFSLDPVSINPDFLRYNDIVGADWKIEGPVTVEPRLTRVAYDNGVVITATRNRVTFAQTGQLLDLDNFVGSAMAMRYISSVALRLGYEAVAIAPRGFIRIPPISQGESSTILERLRRRLPFAAELPRVQARVSYNLAGRGITLYVGEAVNEAAGAVSMLRFSAHIHHNVPESGPSEQTDFVRSVVESWREDLADFDRLAIQFYHESFKGG